jgi:Kef-type K+ transport system membrane component KefB
MDFLPTTAFTFSPLLAFALLLLVGALGGYLAHLTRWVPSITGFMVVGFLIGPSGLGLLDKQTLLDARILIDIALALILYRLGTSLDLRFIRQHPALVLTSLAEASVTFIACFVVLHWLDFSVVLSALISAMLISSSPAVLLHVAHETGAKGPVTETAKTLVALNNCWSFLVFAAVIPALLFDQHAGLGQVILQPLYLLFGSALLGISVGSLLHLLCLRTQKAQQYKMALVIGSLMLTLALAQQLQLSALFAPLLIGITVRSLERGPLVSELNFGAAFELFFIVLFVFAGAKLQLSALWQFGVVIVSLVLVRSVAKILLLWLAGTLQRQRARTSVSTGMLLVPMAGLAIGLAQTSSGLSAEHATAISAIVLGAVTLFETIGPPLAAFAFRFAGEAGFAHAENKPVIRLSQPDSWQEISPTVLVKWHWSDPLKQQVEPPVVPAMIPQSDVEAGANKDAVSATDSTTKLPRLFKWR